MPQSTTRRRRLPRAKFRSPRRPSLLILHLDAEQLRRDGLHLGKAATFAAALAALGLDADVEVREATDQKDLLSVLADLASQNRAFDVIVAVGHSNSEGIVIAANTRPVPWATFAEYLKPFRPRRLMLVACQAGRWLAADTLFTRLRQLRRIFASPVKCVEGLRSISACPRPLRRRRAGAKTGDGDPAAGRRDFVDGLPTPGMEA
jgi:hypothetical protein